MFKTVRFMVSKVINVWIEINSCCSCIRNLKITLKSSSFALETDLIFLLWSFLCFESTLICYESHATANNNKCPWHPKCAKLNVSKMPARCCAQKDEIQTPGMLVYIVFQSLVCPWHGVLWVIKNDYKIQTNFLFTVKDLTTKPLA